jgi:hypothetical protein
VLNASYDELVLWLGRASIGISSMVDEHFGINVVDFTVRGRVASRSYFLLSHSFTDYQS